MSRCFNHSALVKKFIQPPSEVRTRNNVFLLSTDIQDFFTLPFDTSKRIWPQRQPFRPCLALRQPLVPNDIKNTFCCLTWVPWLFPMQLTCQSNHVVVELCISVERVDLNLQVGVEKYASAEEAGLHDEGLDAKLGSFLLKAFEKSSVQLVREIVESNSDATGLQEQISKRSMLMPMHHQTNHIASP